MDAGEKIELGKQNRENFLANFDDEKNIQRFIDLLVS
jgi:hypothetical protein